MNYPPKRTFNDGWDTLRIRVAAASAEAKCVNVGLRGGIRWQRVQCIAYRYFLRLKLCAIVAPSIECGGSV